MEEPTVMVGMSGGVDSSVAAMLLTREGRKCLGVTMTLWEETDCTDAAAIARQLGISHCHIDCRQEFRQTVIRDFIDSCEQGLTPNPCIVCNRTMKFGLMLEKARALGCRYVATGHYARIRQDPDSGRYLLRKALDSRKDQTYFLSCLTQEQLASSLFPLGELTKDQIRGLAEKNHLITAHKRDSQDICFIPDGDYVSFLKAQTGRSYPSGDYLNLEGQVIGTHRGAVCYTLGQRRGLGIALGSPAYVCGKDMKNNTVTLGHVEALMAPALLTHPVNWIAAPREEPIKCTGKIRHSQFDQPATLFPQSDGSCIAVFDQPQRAICPGQTAVFYQGDTVLCGGIIAKAMQQQELPPLYYI